YQISLGRQSPGRVRRRPMKRNLRSGWRTGLITSIFIPWRYEMELRHLRYFVTVAAERSFSRASERLNIAQPPLSRQLQQLVLELGTQLLHRGRPITLTDSGRYFFEQAMQVLQRTDEIRAMTRRIGTGKRSQFGIGFVASTLYDVLPELIRRFRLVAPGVEIVLAE